MNMEQLEENFERGKRFLDRLELADAEEVFRDILRRVPIYQDPHTDTIVVGSLFGLGEVHAKHCRNAGITPLDWTCGMLFALLFYRTTSEVCAKIVRHRSSSRREERANRTGSRNAGDQFSDTLARAKSQASAAESTLLAALRGRVLETTELSVFGAILPVRRRKAVALEDGSWLEGLWDFCCRSVVEYQSDDVATTTTTTTTRGSDDTGSGLSGSGALGLQEDPKPGLLAKRRFSLIARNSGVETAVQATPVSDDLDRNPGDGLPSQKTDCSTGEEAASSKRRINFDRFQDAIKQFVSDVSQEMRWKYANFSGKIPGGLLEKRVCSELAMRFTAECDDAQELETIYETLLKEEDVDSTADVMMEERLEETAEDFQDSDSEEEVSDGREETLDLYIKPSAVYSWKRESAAKYSIPICNGLIPYGTVPFQSAAVTLASRSDAKRIEQNRKIGAKLNGITARNNAPGIATSCSMNRLPGNPGTLSDGKSGILTKWLHVEKNSEHLVEVSWPAAAAVSCGFQEVSAFTDRKERLSSSIVGGSDAGLRRYINEAKLSQILATAVIKLADALKKDAYRVEAIRLYRYAYGILKVYPLTGGQQEMLAKLLVDIGSTCCGAGEFESGSQLMRQAAALYEASGEMLREAEVWYQLGNALLSDKLRQESLLAKVMQMIKDDVKRDDDINNEDNSNDDDDDDEEADEGDNYCTCIYEAIDCYKRSLAILHEQSGHGSQDPGLLADVLTNLADCHVMTGSVDRAEHGYEAALRLFSDTVGRPLLRKNAHVLAMVGTLSFLAGNFVRSATMFETAHALRQHLLPTNADDERSLEVPWSLTVLALSYHFLGHHDRTVTWCVRAFKLYARFFGGRLLSVDPLSRWFVVQNLFVLGFAYSSLRLHRKALHYLNFCRNMMVDVDEDCDPDQSTQVYLALGDAYLAVEDKATADGCYEEAQRRLRTVEQGSATQRVLSEEVAVRLEGGGGGGQVPIRSKGIGRMVHDQAVFVQRDAETSIKDKTISILLRLGISGSSSSEEKDIDLAIGCYDDCVQGYRDLKEPTEAARALASLGSLCQVKGRLQDATSTRRREFLQKAEKYFRDACDLVDSGSPVHVQYGNFLYGEGRYLEALQLLLPFVFCKRSGDLELVYGGIEQMALPVHLHHCIDEDETLVVEARVLAKFLAVLSYRALRMTKDVDDSLEEMYRSVTAGNKPLNYVLLGYALLECRLFRESAEAFRRASQLQPESDAAYFAAWATLLLAAYAVMAAGLDRLLQGVLAPKNNERGTWTFHEKKTYLRRQILRRSRRRVVTGSNSSDNLENNGTSSVQVKGNHSNPVQSYVNSQDACLRQSPSLSPGVRRHVVIETRCRPPEVNDEDAKMKWRTRIYHNLPDTSAANSG